MSRILLHLLIMEPFYVVLAEQIFTIQGNMDESFSIYQENRFIAVLRAHCDDAAGVIWTSTDLISKDLVAELGELIMRYEL